MKFDFNLSIYLLIIDMQFDFVDPKGALSVPGAVDDALRVADILSRKWENIEHVFVSLDMHHPKDVAHPTMWQDNLSQHPAPMVTVITHNDVMTDVWQPVDPELTDYMLEYTRQLEAGGKFPLIIWNEHCGIGSIGATIYEPVQVALDDWERATGTHVEYIMKGMNPLTEHYGIFEAEVPVEDDPSTKLNEAVLEKLRGGDIILVVGEASSHCVKTSVEQMVKHIGAEHVHKIWLLRDCMSSIPAMPGADFPAMTEAFFAEMQALGVTVTTSDVLDW